MTQPSKVGLALPAASALRDRAERFSERAARRTRPRKRFLNTQRSRFAARLLPTLAFVAALSGLLAIAEAVGKGTGLPESAVLGEALVAILVGACAIGVVLARRSYNGLIVLACAGAFTTLLGWAFVIRESTGPTSPYVMIL